MWGSTIKSLALACRSHGWDFNHACGVIQSAMDRRGEKDAGFRQAVLNGVALVYAMADLKEGR